MLFVCVFLFGYDSYYDMIRHTLFEIWHIRYFGRVLYSGRTLVAQILSIRFE